MVFCCCDSPVRDEERSAEVLVVDREKKDPSGNSLAPGPTLDSRALVSMSFEANGEALQGWHCRVFTNSKGTEVRNAVLKIDNERESFTLSVSKADGSPTARSIEKSRWNFARIRKLAGEVDEVLEVCPTFNRHQESLIDCALAMVGTDDRTVIFCFDNPDTRKKYFKIFTVMKKVAENRAQRAAAQRRLGP
uniref:Uncharacterized protein n=1 Tax=Chromera velia CCMP2878 TaxID=1169474 RepID=A0A0G4HSC6_9ALVE|eukprot:Cvel_30999.t1-p1 / transcript=Cvel_30999.t1 / gene=Cvel_30999 / organism=Chromera_velia_CCMP2878 / gene_product=hypothetical protein / transcript_product=hypothetical protein / location=Cvel_scaffold4532:506-3801(+) / protein_length=191 / sequence_SO=supercontig / SO=protein_coding / is_pseudo=false